MVRILTLIAIPLASHAVLLQCQRLDPVHIAALARTEAPSAIELFREYLSLPNDAHKPADLQRVVAWLESQFTQRGFSTELLETDRIPVLLAERSFPHASKTVLVYLQSDGQPVDPAAWHQADPYSAVLKGRSRDGDWREQSWSRVSEAFDPELRIFARSASDSKGPNIQFLKALDALEQAGVPPSVNVKVLVDTEEELGSPNLPGAVQRYRDRLAADMLVIFDGPPHISGRPTLTFGARGIATFTLTTYGPHVPQHSGHYGNWAPNPALRLSQILASMKDAHGRVTIPGFYDGVEIDDLTKAELDRVPDDEPAIMRQLGIGTTDSVGRSLQEARQYASLNIRGMSSGWVGAQRRTIIPATATAEVDVRLVMESDPQRLLRLIRDHVEGLGYRVLDRTPTEEERRVHPRLATFTSSISYGAFRTPFDSEPGRWLSAALRHLHGEDPIRIRTSGGSIPISLFVETLSIPAVTVPTVNPDNNQHSPNENIRLGSFIDGIATMIAVLSHPIGS